jgi:hypothetical protein
VQDRDETPLERSDRNWDELLGELRVTQTGTAILFSLLLTVPFAARFDEVDRFGRGVYLAALVLAAASAVVLIAPVAYHRVLFGQRQKPQVVRASNRMAVAGLVLLAGAMTAVLLLVGDVILRRAWAVGLSSTFGVLTVGLWFVPALLRRRAGRARADDAGPGAAPAAGT